MAGTSSAALVRSVRTLFESGAATGLTDRQVLDQFTSQRDAAAFEVLVLRHGPMVLRVYRNMLRDPNDVHDAFQATFLILVKQRGMVQTLNSVGGWLFGVASRVAARARVDAARRRAAEQRAALRVVEAFEPTTDDDQERKAFGPVVQEELRRLPDKYRSAVVLCYWEGLTQEQAAAQLGCPLGTVRSRLVRARDLLRRRLIRRGFAPLGEMMVAGWADAPASPISVSRQLSPVPPELIASTSHAAAQLAAGKGIAQVVTAAAASLVYPVIWGIPIMKIKIAIAGLALFAFAGSCGWIAAFKGPMATAQAGTEQKSGPPAGKATTVRREIIRSTVPGQLTVITLANDGVKVKKGDVVCQLDSSALADQLLEQHIAVESARANYESWQSDREIAEIALIEYREGTFKLEFAEVKKAIYGAETELALAEDERQLGIEREKNDKAAAKRALAAELVEKRARFSLEIAQTRQKILVEYSRGKKIKELKSGIQKARSNELAQKAIWELRTTKAKGIERQIERCTIRAPQDGTVRYSAEVGLEEGTTVREGQRLFEIVP